MENKVLSALNGIEIKEIGSLNLEDYDKYPIDYLASFSKELLGQSQGIVNDTFSSILSF